MDKSLNQITYDNMKKDIMTLSLKPGDQVSAAKIAERYNVSRTPAREALVKLEAEGLIDIFPQSKSIISKIDVKRSNQEWFLRKTLEMGMVDSLFENVKPEHIATLREYCKYMEEISKLPRSHETAYQHLKSDNDFHGLIYAIAGQQLSSDIISTFGAHYNRVRMLVDLDNFYKERTVTTHEHLIDLLEKGDKEGYRRLLDIHLSYITSDIENMMKLCPDMFKEVTE